MARIAKKAGAYHHGDLRRVLLDAAVRVVDKEGIGALSLHALARKAGVSSGAPYHHFESREQLLAAIAVEGFELLAAAMKRGAEEAGARAGQDEETPGEAYLRGLGHGYVRFALAHRGHFRIMFRPELRAQLGKREPDVDEAFAMLTSAVVRCQEEGTIPPGDPRPLVLLAWASVHGASVLWIDGTLSTDELVADADALGPAIADTLVGLLRRGRPVRAR
jgi:AcrR family transcriptional regulator